MKPRSRSVLRSFRPVVAVAGCAWVLAGEAVARAGDDRTFDDLWAETHALVDEVRTDDAAQLENYLAVFRGRELVLEDDETWEAIRASLTDAADPDLRTGLEDLALLLIRLEARLRRGALQGDPDDEARARLRDRILDVLGATDADPLRRAAWQAFLESTRTGSPATLRTLAEELDAHAADGRTCVSIVGLLHAAGEDEAALALLHRRVARHPGSFRVQYWIGRLATTDGELAEALDHADKAIVLFPECAWTYHNFGVALAFAEDEEALEVSRRALELAPEAAVVRCAHVNALLLTGDLEGAQRALDEGMELTPKQTDLMYWFGWLQYLQGDDESARATFERVLAIDPSHGFALYRKGHFAFRDGDGEAALRDVEEAVRREPDFAEGMLALAQILTTGGQKERAVAECERALAAAPNDAGLRSTVAITLRQNGMPERALEVFRSAIELAPRRLDYRGELARTLVGLERVDQAIAVRAEMTAMAPESPQAHAGLGRLFFQLGRFDEAVQPLARAVQLAPKAPEPNHLLAHALQAVGLPEGAAEGIRAAAKEIEGLGEPALDDPNVVGGIGCMYAIAGDAATARPHLERALDLEPRLVHTYTPLFRVLGELGEVDAAIDVGERFLELQPNEATFHCELAWLVARKSEWARALELLREGDRLGRGGPGWPHPSDRWVVEFEGLAARADLIAGTVEPASAADRLWLAAGQLRRGDPSDGLTTFDALLAELREPGSVTKLADEAGLYPWEVLEVGIRCLADHLKQSPVTAEQRGALGPFLMTLVEGSLNLRGVDARAETPRMPRAQHGLFAYSLQRTAVLMDLLETPVEDAEWSPRAQSLVRQIRMLAEMWSQPS